MDDVVGRGFVRFIGNNLNCGYWAVAEAGNGHLYALPRRQGRVLEIDPLSGLVQELGEAFTEPSTEGAWYATLAAGPNGHLYAAPTRARRVLEIDPYAGLVKHIGPDFGEAIDCPHYTSIAAAGDGCLYAPPAAPGHVLKIDTVRGEVLTIGERIEYVSGRQYDTITMARNGCLYAAPLFASQVLEIEVATGVVGMIGDPNDDDDSDTDMYDCLTLANNGKLYAAPASQSSRVLEIDPACRTSRKLGADLGDHTFLAGLQECPDGKLWGLSVGGLSEAVMIEVDSNTGTVTVHKAIDFLEDFELNSRDDTQYISWIMAGNGRLYASPSEEASGCILEFDPQLLVARRIGTPVGGCESTACAAAVSNGRVILMPSGENGRVVLVDYHGLPRQTGNMQSVLRAALLSGDLSDAVIKTTTGKTYCAHKLILSLRSRVFRSMFAASMREANDAVVELGDVAANVSDMFMKYLYAENAETDRMTLQELSELTALAHRYEIEDLCSACCGLLKVSIRVRSAAPLLRLSDQLQLSDLKDACLDFIVANQDVVDTNEWEELPPALLREAAAALTGRRCKTRSSNDLEFPATTDWTKLTVPKLRRACAERGLAQEGDAASLLERLQA